MIENKPVDRSNKPWCKKAAGIVFTDGRSILLLRRAGEGEHIGTWALPGGKNKNNETEIANAVRETKEETGIDAIPGARFDSMSVKNGPKKFTTFLYWVEEPFAVQLSKEHDGSRWVPFQELKGIDLHPKLKESLPDYLHSIRKKTRSFQEWRDLRLVEVQLALT
jgi:mutator protein MutT